LFYLSEDISFWETVERFNANVAYSGLVHSVSQDGIFVEKKEKLIKDALIALLTRNTSMQTPVINASEFMGQRGIPDREVRLQLEEARFQAIRRLVASKAGFESFTQLSGVRENLGRAVITALAQNDDSLTHAVIDAVNTLMQPMHDNPDLRQEQLNKSSIMSSAPFMRQLVNLFTLHSLRCTGSLVISGLLDFFTYALCLPYSETSDGQSFEVLLALVASRGRALFRLFTVNVYFIVHPSLTIVKGAGLVMRALIDEASEELVAQLRQMALVEGAILQHISIACFTAADSTTADPRNLVLRQLSRQLIALWTDNNAQAQDLLKRIFPEGLLSFLESSDPPPESEKDYLFVRDNFQLAQEHVLRVQSKKSEPLYILQERVDGFLQHWRVKVGLNPRKASTPNIEDKPVSLRLTRQMRIKLGTPDTHVNGKPAELPQNLNWPLFYYHFHRDHAKPDLVWNLRTRDELRDAIEKEMGEYRRECEYFSHSRLEEVDESDTLQDPDTLENGETEIATEASDVTMETKSSSPTETARVEGQEVGRSNETVADDSPFDKKNPLERQVARLLSQVNGVSWNHSEFRVRYHSLAGEPRVGNYFLRLLLEEDKRLASADSNSTGDASKMGLSRIKNSREFFSELFRRYLQYTAALGTMSSATILGGGRLPRGKKGTHGRRQGNQLLSMRCLCLNAMTIVYGRCHEEIGAVSDIPLLVHLLDRTPSAAERDCLIQLLEKLVVNKYNADEFIEADGVRVVTDLACLSYLHTSRAPVPTATNVLKGDSENPDSAEGGGATQPEWWYWKTGDPKGSSEGPFTFAEMRQKFSDGTLAPNTYVFAQGLDSHPRCRIEGVFIDMDGGEEEEEAKIFGSSSFTGFGATTSAGGSKSPSASTLGWMPANRVPQLRWSVPRLLYGDDYEEESSEISDKDKEKHSGDDLIAKLGFSKGAMLDHTALAIRCVEVLTRLCESSASRDASTGGIIRPLPRPRRTISSLFNLPHIVQLLLTFDPPLVERVSNLLLHVIDQNPCLPRIYLTGIFFFILMYTGSNVLPIARFLKATHLLQAEETSETGLPSVLSKILPEAMIAFLENHPPEKFAEIFLGNFDTPEAIWSQEMRQFMISRIAAHLADFTPRLKSNVRAIYHHIGIPRIVYSQLEGELFCNRYYLRHFCDTNRFPDWPIKDPITLLRDILRLWRTETEKKPCRITYEDSLKELGLDASQLNESNQEASIRRAYYQLSMKYHPDKNPDGHSKFQAVKAAYNFLCERGLHSDGPNRRHIQLLIRSQSILYSRYRKAPYKLLYRRLDLEPDPQGV
uniref:J domain-containing protein n=1 Tax=Rodentolepis nana TaxID=102285 RepID=A0A0R3TA83_RODNA